MKRPLMECSTWEILKQVYIILRQCSLVVCSLLQSVHMTMATAYIQESTRITINIIGGSVMEQKRRHSRLHGIRTQAHLQQQSQLSQIKLGLTAAIIHQCG